MISSSPNHRSKRQIIKQFWVVVKPYWVSEEKFIAWTFLALSIITIIVGSLLSVMLARQSGNMISSLQVKKSDQLLQAILTYLGILAIYFPIATANSYFPSQLTLYWRRWMTSKFLGKYFSDRNYYHLTANSEIDNPDQRISEDINTFTNATLSLLNLIIDAVSTLLAVSAAIWLISPSLLIIVLIYGILGNVIAFGIFGRILTRLNFQQFKKEANFRFGLIRVRDNVESIAFYQGEAKESQQLQGRFQKVIQNQDKIVWWQYLYLQIFSNVFEYIPILLPLLVLTPKILAGTLLVGVLQETRANISNLTSSLKTAIDNLEQFTTLAASLERLETLVSELEKHPIIPTDGKPWIDNREDKDQIAISHLTLQTPNYQRTLFNNLSVNIPLGDRLLVVGESGTGKSSFLRAIAGLWKSGTGLIIRPSLSNMLFLAQRPYLITGTLREQLIYPHINKIISEQELQKVLEMVNLANLAARIGGFDNQVDFASILSPGEQQRIAFARVLLAQSSYVILDESTSALDIENEEKLYQHLQKNNTTIISVGHRSTLIKYHQQILKLTPDQQWQITSADNYNPE